MTPEDTSSVSHFLPLPSTTDTVTKMIQNNKMKVIGVIGASSVLVLIIIIIATRSLPGRVKSSGVAGKMRYDLMGVYEQNREYHNKKPVWSRHDGTQKMFYDNGRFPFN